MTTTKYPAIQKLADEIGEPMIETIERLYYMRIRKMVKTAHKIQNPSSPTLTDIEVIEQGGDILNAMDEEDDDGYVYEVYCAGSKVILAMSGLDVLAELNEWELQNF